MAGGKRQVADGVGRSDDYQTDESIPLTPLTRNLPANYLRPSVDAILASVSPNCVARIVALSRQVASLR